MPPACVAGDEAYQGGLDAYAARRYADAARRFTDAAHDWNDAAADAPEGEVKEAYRRDRWAAYAGAAQALLATGDVEGARRLLRAAQAEAPDLAAVLAGAERALPAPPSCWFEGS